jgi:hypothetical protein
MWKKSTASMLVAWVRRNCCQLVSVCRAGAGGIWWGLRIRRIVEVPTRWPSVSSSPRSLWYPQLGLSVAVRTINAAIALLIGGRPGVFGYQLLAHETAMPAQDGVRGDQAMALQCPRQSPDERGEHGPVRPLQAGSGVGAAQDRDLVAKRQDLSASLAASERASSTSELSTRASIR